MANKEKLTAEMVVEAIRLTSNGVSDKDVAIYLGVAQSTYAKWKNQPSTDNQRSLSEGIKRAEVKRKAWHIDQIQQAAAKGSWQASAWYLERRYPQEWAKAERVMEDPNKPEIEAVKKVMVQIVEAANNR